MGAVSEAIRSGDLEAVRNAVDRDPRLARKPQLILEAARRAQLEVLKLLAERGASLNAGWRGYRPLHALIQEKVHGESVDPPPNRLRCLDWLLENGADPEQLGAWPPSRALLVAAFQGVPEYVERLLRAGARRDVFAACALGDLAQVRRELKRDPAIVSSRDSGGLTALQCAAASSLWRRDEGKAKKLLDIATLLLDAGADPGVRTKSWSHEVDAAYFAVSAGNGAMLELLLDRGADADPALVSAAWQTEHRFCELCLSRGADVNALTEDGRPLLNEMVRWGQVRRVLWLLEKGADPNLADARGWTAVHQAASRGNARMFRAILDAGGDLRKKDREGRTPLQIVKPGSALEKSIPANET